MPRKRRSTILHDRSLIRGSKLIDERDVVAAAAFVESMAQRPIKFISEFGNTGKSPSVFAPLPFKQFRAKLKRNFSDVTEEFIREAWLEYVRQYRIANFSAESDPEAISYAKSQGYRKTSIYRG